MLTRGSAAFLPRFLLVAIFGQAALSTGCPPA